MVSTHLLFLHLLQNGRQIISHQLFVQGLHLFLTLTQQHQNKLIRFRCQLSFRFLCLKKRGREVKKGVITGRKDKSHIDQNEIRVTRGTFCSLSLRCSTLPLTWLRILASSSQRRLLLSSLCCWSCICCSRSSSIILSLWNKHKGGLAI